MKSKWWLLIDVPLVIVFVVPAILVGFCITMFKIGYLFAEHYTEKHFMRDYTKEAQGE